MFGQIAGAIIGGMATKSAAKKQAAAQRYAADKSAEGFTIAKPYIQDMYAGGQDALNASLNTGAYTGPTFAGLNPTQMQGINYLTGFGQNAIGQGKNFMNQGNTFGSNYQDIYNRAAGPTLDNAIDYATSSPQASSMIDAIMRDSTRRLNEQTMPGIGMSASNTGNTNSSRAGVAEALAQRAYDDRRADVSADVFKSLSDQYLRSNSQDITNMSRANEGLKNTYGIGFGMAPEIAGMFSTAGNALQTNDQGQMNADMNQFNNQRDFALDQYTKFNAGILNNAPQAATYQPVTANPTTAAIGGAMAGFGIGGKLSDLFKQKATTQPVVNQNPLGTPNGSMYGINNNIYGFQI